MSKRDRYLKRSKSSAKKSTSGSRRQSQESLENLFHTELKDRLQEIDIHRAQAVKWVLLAFGVIALSALLIFILVNATAPEGLFIVIGVIGGLTAIVFFFLSHSANKKYRSLFKHHIVKEIFELALPGVTYHPSRRISDSTYHNSQLFLKGVDRWNGDDYVRGEVGKTDFEFSELHTEYKTTSTDSKGNRKTHWHTIFKGVFFSADFKKHLKSETFVLPDRAESLFGSWLGEKLQSFGSVFSGHGNLVKLEDPEFEDKFVVYSKNQIEARYVLTPVMMESILDLKRRFRSDIRLSFLDSRVYVAISMSGNLFEPHFWSSKMSLDELRRIESLFLAILSVIDELDLNTRIWTKK